MSDTPDHVQPALPDGVDLAAVPGVSDTSLLSAPTRVSQGRWTGRPVLARLVRALVVILPLALATAASWAVSRALPSPTATVDVVVDAIAIIATAFVVAWASRPLAKRLLPLSALLELTLVFPDEAPSRMATALRSRSEDELAELVDRTRVQGLPTDSVEAAKVILELVAELSRHDRITRGHSERVRVYASLIGEEMGLSQEAVAGLGWAGLLHDIGKLAVDTRILNKPGRLDDDEYDKIKMHAAAGAAMVEPLRGWLGDVIDAVGQHHERWDGNGYPNGLGGEEISLAARIIAVADVFDVITAQRSYKKASLPAEARQEIADHSGTQFDPKVVRAFLAISVSEFKVVRGPLAVLAQLPVLSSISAPAVVAPGVGAAAATAVMSAALMMPSATFRDSFRTMPAPSADLQAPAGEASAAGGPEAGAPTRATVGRDGEVARDSGQAPSTQEASTEAAVGAPASAGTPSAAVPARQEPTTSPSEPATQTPAAPPAEAAPQTQPDAGPQDESAAPDPAPDPAPESAPEPDASTSPDPAPQPRSTPEPPQPPSQPEPPSQPTPPPSQPTPPPSRPEPPSPVEPESNEQEGGEPLEAILDEVADAPESAESVIEEGSDGVVGVVEDVVEDVVEAVGGLLGGLLG